ncbi:MAG TPA: HlyD family efflux transporter periplasmic adaptor subunit [Thermoanaerobaculia bacterium]|nr:HlyD family efflux transporter periplasmic adaptor subunit [Thermoanaerobaculia bacterium]
MSETTADVFRQEAIDARLAEKSGTVVRITPPWTWSVFAVIAAMFVVALALAVFGRIEVTDRGRGILRPVAGVRSLHAPVGGVVAEVYTASGELVAKGKPIARLESVETQQAVLQADRQLELLRSDFQRSTTIEDREYAEQAAALAARMDVLRQQMTSAERSVATATEKSRATDALLRQGLVSSTAADAARDELERSGRELQTVRQALLEVKQELSSRREEHQNALWGRRERLHDAEARRDALAFPLQQSVIRAPESGYVEALLARRGDFLRVGDPVGKLIPRDSAFHVVSFLPEKDRAFVRPGSVAYLEFDQYPYGEFGTLEARIVRISNDLASVHETREALGDTAELDGPAFRVELRVAGISERIRVRPGMLMNVRYVLRRERPIVLLFEPLRRWLG